MMWSVLHLLFLLSVPTGFTHNLQGLFCVNDYINNITCVWNSSAIDPDVACQLLGTNENFKRNLCNSSCDLKPIDMPGQGHSFRGCSIVFEGHYFSSAEHLPSIKVGCNGSEEVNLRRYKPINHIKMHPPGNPVIINGTNATWSAGSPLSKKIFQYEFQVKVKREDQLWEEARSLTRLKQEPWMELDVEESGIHHIRLRVKPTRPASSHWSEWSPTASWTSEGEVSPTFVDTVESPDLTLWLVLSGAFFTLIVVILLVFYKTHTNNRKHQYVPDPAKYFQPLNSVHGGNFQKWLSPLFAPESFITAQPCEAISPVEVSGTEVWDITDSTSSTTAAFLLNSDPNTPSDGWNSSGQSSCFSNIGYFYPKYPSSLFIESCPVYFTYQGDHSSLSSTSSSYECLERLGRLQSQPLSPDSGFGMESLAGEDQVEEEGKGKKERNVVSVAPPLVLPVSLPARIPPGPHHPLSLPQLPLHNPESNPAMASSGSYNAWPVEAALGRSSSMTVEPSCSGYLTIKELQNTYSNKSI
ncbi:interleukin-2 receptor subunit beta isoform X1 [Salmo trutta]|uniref:Interleukin 2 receptor, beta n=2 Tax=Salmo trutta TaxID=8032 RepID=A0A673YPT2_SALTR|nr:interleukin-2 receptor subunit beta isoform X1 [Salmo trutta]XP_029583181.1 interleukin-2 receptor subunit beta isoform X1 [Salmo trutta]XP_029583182.1 interleukin-2 receptor subunit beta isoform X1 [Salmo trutta]